MCEQRNRKYTKALGDIYVLHHLVYENWECSEEKKETRKSFWSNDFENPYTFFSVSLEQNTGTECVLCAGERQEQDKSNCWLLNLSLKLCVSTSI